MKASDPMTHAKLREAAEAQEKIAALKTNDPTNPAHRLADDLRMSRVSSLEQRDDLIAVLTGDAEKDATITRLEAEIAELRAERDQVAGESAWWKRVVDGEHVPSGEVASIKHLHPAMVKPIYDAHKGTAVADVIAGLIFSLAITQNREQFLVGHANDRATKAEAELSAARAGLEEATGLIGLFRNFALSGVHFAYPLGSVQQLEAFLAPRSRQAAITGGE